MVEDGRKYWNPVLETLDSDRHLALELKNLRKLIQYAKDHSVFYREKYKDIIPEEIVTSKRSAASPDRQRGS